MTVVVLQKMITLVAIMLIGFAFARAGKIDSAFSQKASFLVVNLFIVGTILTATQGTGEGMTSRELALAVAACFGIFFLGAVLGWVMARLLPFQGKDKQVAWLSVFFMNNCFIGFPIVEAAFGQSGLLIASLTNLPFNLLLYSIGAANLRQGTGQGRVTAREVITTPLVATCVAVVLVVFHLPLPGLLADTMSVLGAATVPVSMLVIGISLSQVSMGEALRDWRCYVVSFVKLLLCPLLTWWLLGLFLPPDDLIRGVLTLISACPSAALITILCVRYGADDKLASKINFMSTLLSAVTMPIMAMLLL